MRQDVHTSEIDSMAEKLSGEDSFAVKVVRASWALFFVSVLIQCVFHWSIENLACMTGVAIGWIITTRTFMRQSMLKNFPFSSFLIIGFTASELYLPLVFTTMEGKSMIFNLELPEEIFMHFVVELIVLTAAHALYRFLWRVSFTRSYSVLEYAGFFSVPSYLQLWLMGGIGMAAQWYVYFNAPDIGREVTGSAGDKLIQALIPFSYAPFFIPFGKLYGSDESYSKKIYPMLIAYTALLFALSIGRNSRGAFMFGFTSIGFAYILGLLMGVFKTRLFTVRNAIIAGAFFWLLTGPMADLGTAMVVVRGERDEMSAMELISRTLDAYWDKDAIRAQRLEDMTVDAANEWDEPYLDNIFAARFANIKFADMTMIQYEKIGDFDPDMQEFSIDYFLCALPEPFMRALNIDADKEAVYSVSFGDYIYLLGGGTGFPNGFRTGHFSGTGMTAFGWWYLAILGVLILPIFLLFDKFYKRNRSPRSGTPFTAQFSLCGLLAITSVWQFLPNESVAMLAIYLLRGWIQLALLYFVLFHVTRILSRMFGHTRRIAFRV